MKVTDKEVLHRMCDKIKLSDAQREDIMKKINEEASGRKRAFNVRRFAAVAASVLVLAGTTVFAEAKYGIVGDIVDRISNVYEERGGVVLNEAEKVVVDELSLDGTEVGGEFEVDGMKVRIDGVMYDSSFIYLMYTVIPDEDFVIKNEFASNWGGASFKLFVNGTNYSGGKVTSGIDLDENEEGYQGYKIFEISPIQYVENAETGVEERVHNFSLSQGDVITLTDEEYRKVDWVTNSIEDYEKIYTTFTLDKPFEELVFTCDNTEGMDILETILEIKVTPLSVTVTGSDYLRKTYPEDIGYKYIERVGGIVVLGRSKNAEADKAHGKYNVSIVKKDGTIAKYGSGGGGGAYSTNSRVGNEMFYNQRVFEKPLDLSEVDYILVEGWGLEYKIPVNVE